MPICMGVLCERCRTVYFISSSGTSTHITYNRARGEFKLACDPPCNAITFFQKGMLKAYAVTAETLEHGSVSIRQCQQLGEQREAADQAKSWWQAGN
jgi:hypothetical protein